VIVAFSNRNVRQKKPPSPGLASKRTVERLNILGGHSLLVAAVEQSRRPSSPKNTPGQWPARLGWGARAMPFFRRVVRQGLNGF